MLDCLLILPLSDAELTTRQVVKIVVACAAVVLALVVAFLVVSRLRRRLQEPDAPAAAAGFTLADLRQLHKSGQMSTEEFERAKAKVVESARRAAEQAEARRRQAGGADRSGGGF